MFTHVYSDPHFGHRNICRYANRPFTSVHEMNETLLSNYNEVIGVNDYCLWLGDALFMPKDVAKKMVESLHGFKVIIKGNHDGHSARWFLDVGFSCVFDTPIHLSIAGRPARASHYPYVTTIRDMPHHKYREHYPIIRKGEILLHGHTHSPIKIYGNQIHVGVDAWNYYPVSIKQIEELINQKIVK